MTSCAVKYDRAGWDRREGGGGREREEHRRRGSLRLGDPAQGTITAAKERKKRVENLSDHPFRTAGHEEGDGGVGSMDTGKKPLRWHTLQVKCPEMQHTMMCKTK